MGGGFFLGGAKGGLSAEGVKLRLPKARSPSQLWGLGERRKLPCGVWGSAPEADAIFNILCQNVVQFLDIVTWTAIPYLTLHSQPFPITRLVAVLCWTIVVVLRNCYKGALPICLRTEQDVWAPPFGRRRLGAAVWAPAFGRRRLGARPFGRRTFGRRPLCERN